MSSAFLLFFFFSYSLSRLFRVRVVVRKTEIYFRFIVHIGSEKKFNVFDEHKDKPCNYDVAMRHPSRQLNYSPKRNG